MRKFKIIALLLAVLFLVSCSEQSDKPESEALTEGTVTFKSEDGYTLQVNISENSAEITEPKELCGVGFIFESGDQCRILYCDKTIPVSKEAGKGISDWVYAAKNVKAGEFEQNGASFHVEYSEDGTPFEIKIERDGLVRKARVSLSPS